VALARGHHHVEEEPVPTVHLRDGHQHHDHEPQRRGTRQEADEYRQPAEALDERGEDGRARRYVHLPEPGDRRRQPVATEPPEHLLRAVGEEDDAQPEAHHQVGPRGIRAEHEPDQVFHGTLLPVAMRPASSYSRCVRRVSLHGRRPPRVYYRFLPAILALLAASVLRPTTAGSQVELTVYEAMVKGPANAPVTIIEFSDYQ